MEPATAAAAAAGHKTLEPDPSRPRSSLTLISLPNGVLKKHSQPQPQPQQQRTLVAPASAVYRECLKNHAASLGGHSLDGCGEFMASPSSNPSDPTSLTCAACACHRNFHRRLSPPPPPPPPRQLEQQVDIEDDGRESRDADASAAAANGETDENNNNNNNINNNNDSAPHMLMALSAGVSAPQPVSRADAAAAAQIRSGGTSGVGQKQSRKRFRSRFSAEQKGRMLELSERLGWRMQKRDEALVEESCREIGVGKGVFKVWMHNNKHNSFVSSPRFPPPPPPPGDHTTRVNGSGSAAAS